MRYLVDTHVFIWWNTSSTRLPAKVQSLFRDPNETLFLSLASVWEMQIKIQLGKLTLPAPLSILLQRQQQTNAIQILPITLPHVLELASLPDLHRDPFDRLLIAQARVEKASLISDDATIKKYPVTVVW